jgi:hypothetical protein
MAVRSYQQIVDAHERSKATVHTVQRVSSMMRAQSAVECLMALGFTYNPVRDKWESTATSSANAYRLTAAARKCADLGYHFFEGVGWVLPHKH